MWAGGGSDCEHVGGGGCTECARKEFQAVRVLLRYTSSSRSRVEVAVAAVSSSNMVDNVHSIISVIILYIIFA